MKTLFSLFISVLLASTVIPVSANQIIKRDFEGFTVWLDCTRHGAVMFRYNAQHDTGNFKRHKYFYLDPDTPAECQQRSTDTYHFPGQRYDRGHLVPANHLDYSKKAIAESNYMVNIVPQAANMNRGAWLQTEEITECYRDIDELLIIGGVIWGNNPDDDFFIKTHGIQTPDAFWKVIIRNDRIISWIIPNSQEATRVNLDKYLVTVDTIERVTGKKIPVPDYLKHDKPRASWYIPKGCNKG